MTGPVALDPGAYRRALCVAPHPDDETLGCGGFLHLLVARGAAVTVALLTRGEADGTGRPLLLGPRGRAAFRRDLVERRGREFAAAMAALGVADTRVLDGRDGRVGRDADRLATGLAGLVERLAPDLVLAPWPGDAHRDHRAAATIVRAALAPRPPPPPLILGYEVWTPLSPTHVVDLGAAIEVKRRALDCYRARFARYSLDERVLSRNRALGGAEAFVALAPDGGASSAATHG